MTPILMTASSAWDVEFFMPHLAYLSANGEGRPGGDWAYYERRKPGGE